MLKMVQDISNMVNIHYIRQKEPKGLGHAIHCAKSFIGNEPFAVLLGDDIVDSETPCLKQLINAYDEYKTSVLGVQQVAVDDTDKYGILDVKHIEDRVYKVKDMVEQKINVVSHKNLYYLYEKTNQKKLKKKIVYGSLQLPIDQKRSIGKLILCNNGKAVANYPLYSEKNVKKMSFLDKLLIVYQSLI